MKHQLIKDLISVAKKHDVKIFPAGFETTVMTNGEKELLFRFRSITPKGAIVIIDGKTQRIRGENQ